MFLLLLVIASHNNTFAT